MNEPFFHLIYVVPDKKCQKSESYIAINSFDIPYVIIIGNTIFYVSQA